MTVLSGHGIAVALPQLWEGRIFTRTRGSGLDRAVAATARTAPASTAGSAPAPAGTPAVQPGEQLLPVTHLANFALPADRGDYGSGAVDLMGADNCLVALVEFGPESAGTALFATRGLPQPQPQQFDPNTLQRRIPGQLGYQRFFTAGDRAFCLYVVLGSVGHAAALTRSVRGVLAATRIGAR